jgi:hypothetical protein
MSNYDIMAVVVNHRTSRSSELQSVLTQFGCNIKVRLGLHEAGASCSDEGLVLLQLCGEEKEIDGLHNALNKVSGIRAQRIRI